MPAREEFLEGLGPHLKQELYAAADRAVDTFMNEMRRVFHIAGQSAAEERERKEAEFLLQYPAGQSFTAGELAERLGITTTGATVYLSKNRKRFGVEHGAQRNVWIRTGEYSPPVEKRPLYAAGPGELRRDIGSILGQEAYVPLARLTSALSQKGYDCRGLRNFLEISGADLGVRRLARSGIKCR